MKVTLATPTYKGIYCIPFLDSLEATVTLFLKEGIETVFNTVVGSGYVQDARNKLVHQFLESDSDKLFFLDEDVAWDPQDALTLVKSKYKVTAGIYPIKCKDEEFTAVIRCTDDKLPIANADGQLLGARVPTGFLCIDREVFEDIEFHYPHLAFKDAPRNSDDWVDMFDFFPQGVKDGRWVGEDYAFCDLWTGIGGEIVIYPDMTLRHYGGDKVWSGNFKDYLLRCPGGERENKNGEEKRA